MTYRLSLLLVAVFGVWLTAITGLLAQEQYPLEISLSGPAGAYDLKRWKQDWRVANMKMEFRKAEWRWLSHRI